MESNDTFNMSPSMRPILKSDNDVTCRNKTELIMNTLKPYSIYLLIIFVLFSILRKVFFKAYSIRSWVPELKNDILVNNHNNNENEKSTTNNNRKEEGGEEEKMEEEEDNAKNNENNDIDSNNNNNHINWKKGWISWIWNVFKVSDEDFMDNCGLDALCYVRILSFGRKISLMGCLNGLWLMPIYFTASISENSLLPENIYCQIPLNGTTTFNIAIFSINNIETNKSLIYIATLIATYINYFFVLYLITKELKWFVKYRHRFLMQRKPRSYAVFVSGIPKELRDKQLLKEYFDDCFYHTFDTSMILDTSIALDMPKLEYVINRRTDLMKLLEHAKIQRSITGTKRSLMKLRLSSRKIKIKVDDVTQYEDEIEEIDNIIVELVKQIHGHGNNDVDSDYIVDDDVEAAAATLLPSTVEAKAMEKHKKEEQQQQNPEEGKELEKEIVLMNDNNSIEMKKAHIVVDSDDHGDSNDNEDGHEDATIFGVSQHLTKAEKYMKRSLEEYIVPMKKQIRLLDDSNQGKPRNCAFLVFGNLRTAAAARQMLHHAEPNTLKVKEAPGPEDIIWANVGMSLGEKRTGQLVSFISTMGILIFWSLFIGIVASLDNIENTMLTNYPIIGEKYQWGFQKLQSSTPYIILILQDYVLPFGVLYVLALKEGHISNSMVEVSLLNKLSLFSVFQTFLCTALASSLTEIQQLFAKIVVDPRIIAEELASALPRQAANVMILLIIRVVFSIGWAILRGYPLSSALLRKIFGPNLTAEERRTTSYGMFYSLEDPPPFLHGYYLSRFILLFCAFLTYSTITPLTSFLICPLFLIMECGYRYDFIHNQSPHSCDSGGRLWYVFIQIIMGPIMVSMEIFLIGFFMLHEMHWYFLLPLIVITCIFIYYYGHKDMPSLLFLPTHECLQMDLKNEADTNFNVTELIKGQYQQPCLRKALEIIEENKKNRIMKTRKDQMKRERK